MVVWNWRGGEGAAGAVGGDEGGRGPGHTAVTPTRTASRTSSRGGGRGGGSSRSGTPTLGGVAAGGASGGDGIMMRQRDRSGSPSLRQRAVHRDRDREKGVRQHLPDRLGDKRINEGGLKGKVAGKEI